MSGFTRSIPRRTSRRGRRRRKRKRNKPNDADFTLQ